MAVMMINRIKRIFFGHYNKNRIEKICVCVLFIDNQLTLVK